MMHMRGIILSNPYNTHFWMIFQKKYFIVLSLIYSNQRINTPCRRWKWTVCSSTGPADRPAPDWVCICSARWSCACAGQISTPEIHFRWFPRKIWTRTVPELYTFPVSPSSHTRRRLAYCWTYRWRHRYRCPWLFKSCQLLDNTDIAWIKNKSYQW